MRLLVACSQCNRQYDATGRAPGSRFRCQCGAVVRVRQPRGHDAAVVRCSACGAPREQGAESCQFCGATFTLHERDLHTVCPGCLARVSDRARFCHHCGTKLAPELVAGDATRMNCPCCGEGHYLANRRIGELNVLECGHCAGLWLGSETFKQLTEQASSQAVDIGRLFDADQMASAPAGSGSQRRQQAWRYRRCPSCSQMMHRRNYGRRSGIIIDVCKDHGVWFDADELPHILAWIRSGGLARAEKERAARQARQRRLKGISKPAPQRGPVIGVPLGGPDEGSGGFLDEIVRWLMGL